MRTERKEVKIELLKTPEINTRIHPEKQLNEIRRSLKKWGQYKNAVIDENYVILAGNGMVEAMRLEGFKKVWVIIMYDMSQNEKDKLMLADNKTAGLGVDNLNNIQEIINRLDGDFDIPGFDDEVLASVSAAAEEISQAMEEYGKATDDNIAGMEAHADVNNAEYDEPPADTPDTAMTAEPEKKSVICPQCGAEIWL
jgi:ParB-like chromosome segregation protein Spo0J